MRQALLLVLTLGACSQPPSVVYVMIDGGVVIEQVFIDGGTTVETCIDGRRNGNESDVDCGGGCRPCAASGLCSVASDCLSEVCTSGRCAVASCSDGRRNQTESDTDCGGSSCAPCGATKGCAGARDCASQRCIDHVCEVPSCSDGLHNGTETDVDCGGSCPACVVAKRCSTGADCVGQSCVSGVCQLPSCTDGIKNGSESDLDCGGSGCTSCGAGKTCGAAGDCASTVCSANVCAAVACNDNTRNGSETDVDCGGTCAGCQPSLGCVRSQDCASGVCTSQRCAAPSCADGVSNGQESGIDCGGATSCQRCPTAQRCAAPTDCASRVCSNGSCAAPTCTDGAQNGSELGVDCGGGCAGCLAGTACLSGNDCSSGVCTAMVCMVPSCADGSRNGSETGVDCGGPLCPRCGAGQACATAADCSSGVCLTGLCNPGASALAPRLSSAESPPVSARTAFLFSGTTPVQRGVDAGVIEPRRAAAVYGRVIDRSGTGVSDVVVTFVGHPELGSTLTGPDGRYALAFNAGGLLTIDFAKVGVLPLQRTVDAVYGDELNLDDVVVTPLDPRVTTVDLSALTTPLLASGSRMTDDDGARTAAVLFKPGTQATMRVGTMTVPLTTLHFRATEYTVGPRGLAAMPGQLPPTSRYTYAVELSIDEAITAGASTVTFDRPVMIYLDNFIGVRTGELVPVGSYDRVRGIWSAEPNGRVIEVLQIVSGQAVLDVTGTGAPATPQELADLGITANELATIAASWPVGMTLWRAPLTHFTPVDLNYGGGPPPGAGPPPGPPPPPPQPDDCKRRGSIIGCERQTLGYALPIQGTPLSLHYDSGTSRARREEFSFTIPVTGPTVPPGTLRAEVEVMIAGRQFTQTFAPVPNQNYTFTWDGLDAFGRQLTGRQRAAGVVRFVYTPVFHRARADLVASFGQLTGEQLSLDRVRGEIKIQTTFSRTLGVASTPDLGGWRLDAHHSYSLGDGTLFFGDGNRLAVESLGETITTIAGNGQLGFNGDNQPALQASISNGHIAAPLRDGSYVVVDYGNHRLRRVSPTGIISTIAGTGTPGHSGDEGPATAAQIRSPHTLAIGPDDSIYFSEPFENTVRRITPDGVIHAFAGTGSAGFQGDSGPATAARLDRPYFVDVGSDGSVYISDTGNHRIRKVTADGVIMTIVGNGNTAWVGVGMPGTQHQINGPLGLKVDRDGALFFGGYGDCRIRKLGVDGLVRHIAGTGTCTVAGDNGPATAASITEVHGFGIDRDGVLYINEYLRDHVIRRVGADGLITTMSGVGTPGYAGDHGPARRATLNGPHGIRFFPDGSLVFADLASSRIRRIAPPLPSVAAGTFVFPSRDGRLLFTFDAVGRHLSTRDSLTLGALFTFGYDAQSRLVSVTDASSRLTRIERAADGKPQAIIAPDGQRTALALDINGWLATVTPPGGASWRMTSSVDGLLGSLVDRDGDLHRFTYDIAGRLITDEAPDQGVQTLSSARPSATATITTLTTGAGRPSLHGVESTINRGTIRTEGTASGARDTLTEGRDGTTLLTSATGLRTTMAYSPESRFAMQAPVLARTTQTPAGLTQTVSEARTFTLSNPNDPLTVTSAVETRTVNGRAFARNFNVATRSDTRTSPAGVVSVSTLDPSGRLLTLQADPALTPITLVRDSSGRVTETLAGGTSTRTTYGANGLRSSVSVADAGISFTYDAADRLATVRQPSGATSSMTWSGEGRLTSFTTPAQATHQFTVRHGHTTAYLPPSGQPINWTHDRDGNVAEVRAGTRALTISRDLDGRVTTIAAPEFTTTFSYSPTDHPATVSRTQPSGASLRLAFTADGPLTTGWTMSGAAAATVALRYDSNFRLVGTRVDGAAETTRAFDDDDQLTGWGPFVYARLGPERRVSGITRAASTFAVAATFDGLGRELQRSLSVAGAVRYQIDLSYLPNGHLASRTERVGASQRVDVFGYDADGQLLSVTRDGVVVETYTYDVNGNRLTRRLGTAPAEAATFNSSDQLQTIGGTSWSTDNAGFVTQRGADQTTYSLDGALLRATRGGAVVEYVVDGLGRRVKRTEGATSTTYVYATGSHLITHSRDQTGAVSEYFYDARGRLIALRRGASYFSIASDQVGSPRLVIDDTGATVAELQYDAFGALTSAPSSFDLPIGFAGGLYDPTTQLLHFGARDYDPRAGRFLARDPMLFAAGHPNLYSYAGNTPHEANDASGTIRATGNDWALDRANAEKNTETIMNEITKIDSAGGGFHEARVWREQKGADQQVGAALDRYYYARDETVRAATDGTLTELIIAVSAGTFLPILDAGWKQVTGDGRSRPSASSIVFSWLGIWDAATGRRNHRKRTPCLDPGLK